MMDESFTCPYNDENTKKVWLDNKVVKACELVCPINKKTCYRWDICNVARRKEKNEQV